MPLNINSVGSSGVGGSATSGCFTSEQYAELQETINGTYSDVVVSNPGTASYQTNENTWSESDTGLGIVLKDRAFYYRSYKQDFRMIKFAINDTYTISTITITDIKMPESYIQYYTRVGDRIIAFMYSGSSSSPSSYSVYFISYEGKFTKIGNLDSLFKGTKTKISTFNSKYTPEIVVYTIPDINDRYIHKFMVSLCFDDGYSHYWGNSIVEFSDSGGITVIKSATGNGNQYYIAGAYSDSDNKSGTESQILFKDDDTYYSIVTTSVKVSGTSSYTAGSTSIVTYSRTWIKDTDDYYTKINTTQVSSTKIWTNPVPNPPSSGYPITELNTNPLLMQASTYPEMNIRYITSWFNYRPSGYTGSSKKGIWFFMTCEYIGGDWAFNTTYTVSYSNASKHTTIPRDYSMNWFIDFTTYSVPVIYWVDRESGDHYAYLYSGIMESSSISYELTNGIYTITIELLDGDTIYCDNGLISYSVDAITTELNDVTSCNITTSGTYTFKTHAPLSGKSPAFVVVSKSGSISHLKLKSNHDGSIEGYFLKGMHVGDTKITASGYNKIQNAFTANRCEISMN